ncbi:DUF6340 family protein [Proteiniphilum sp. X52]|uniref:DUF6340 family protein n=1 Tax=Proteiniphilum sp. X52 TaxID=2382159 RepID=UPI000F09C6DC|nr:DUF6340 family protein [Proteiniphilum sp. X52]RNC64679.1 hypothetical protein D7D25_10065 [Proteiniphilum sp. X52]
MQKTTSSLIIFLLALLMSSCAGIKYLTVETREPAQVNLPSNVLSIAIVNNVVQQPDEVGHDSIPIGHTQAKRSKVSSDSVAVFYTEALAQFLDEEDYFQRVMYYNQPLRSDHDFFQEKPVDPETMHRIRRETGADAIISLDKLIVETKKRDHFRQQGYTYADMTGKIHSVLRVYMPTMEGKIPAAQYTDSIRWEGFDIQDGRAYADIMLPSRKEAIKILAVHAAEKMTYVFAPHWEMQDRWYYTLPNSLMREGEAYAKGSQWSNAIEKWEAFYNNSSKKTDKAKAAGNIALAYEMIDDMDRALEWATLSNNLFIESTAPNSLERRRSLLYKIEIERRNKNSHKLNMDDL